MAYRLRRFEPLITAVFLAGILLMAGLGIWQLQRLQWKTDLINRIEEANRTAPLTALPTDADALSRLEYRKVLLTGRFLPGELTLTPRYAYSKLGYHLAQPFRIEGGPVVLVNRGWVPNAKRDPSSRPGSAAPKGKTTIAGIIRLGGRKNWVTPDNRPADNLWFWYDLPAMGQAVKQPLLPVVIDRTAPMPEASPFVQGPDGVEWKVLPQPNEETVSLRNDHLGYAITWFAIALGGLAVLLTYHAEKVPE